jgi:hypothetical protein
MGAFSVEFSVFSDQFSSVSLPRFIHLGIGTNFAIDDSTTRGSPSAGFGTIAYR